MRNRGLSGARAQPRRAQAAIGSFQSSFITVQPDFSGGFFQAVSPVVNIVSSGDENARKEYIHPRATWMGALGRWSRVPKPLVFVTELVAFFNVEGWSPLTDAKKGDPG